jgi:ketosteroid isomerase-like protein
LEQTPQSVTNRAVQTKSFEESQIRQIMQDIFNSIRLRDVDGILSHYDEDAVLFDVCDELQTNTQGLRNIWKECFDGTPEYTCEALDFQIELENQIAFGHGLVHARGRTNEGEVVDLWMRLSNAFRKLGGRWVIVHEHYSVPGDFANGKLLQDLEPTKLN